MPLAVSDIEALGRDLAQARRAGEPSAQIDLRRIAGLDDAWAVQDRAVSHFGGTRIGYALRATTPLGARLLGCDATLVAPLLQESMVESGARHRLPRGVIGVGAGFTFVLGRPFPFSDDERLSVENAAQASVACHLDLHILGRRVPHTTPLNVWTATADFGLDVLHLCGPGLTDWRAADLAAADVALALDGHELARGRGSAIPGGPLAPLAWLADGLARRGLNLNAGDLVSTGSCLGLIRVMPGQTVEVELERLGRLTLGLD